MLAVYFYFYFLIWYCFHSGVLLANIVICICISFSITVWFNQTVLVSKKKNRMKLWNQHGLAVTSMLADDSLCLSHLWGLQIFHSSGLEFDLSRKVASCFVLHAACIHMTPCCDLAATCDLWVNAWRGVCSAPCCFHSFVRLARVFALHVFPLSVLFELLFPQMTENSVLFMWNMWLVQSDIHFDVNPVFWLVISKLGQSRLVFGDFVYCRMTEMRMFDMRDVWCSSDKGDAWAADS